MAGGRGERLWPKSDIVTPKQFARITSNKTMLEDTLSRCRLLTRRENIFISTLKEKTPLVKSILPRFADANIIPEPMIRDTACAILLATLTTPAKGNDVLVFMPADHYLQDLKSFKTDINLAWKTTVKYNSMTLIGIKPNYPSGEYGYLKTTKKITSTSSKKQQILTIEKFVEKPTLATSKKYLRSGCYLWNSGIFMFTKAKLLSLFEEHTPTLFTQVNNYLTLLKKRDVRKAEKVFSNIKKISFDYAIAEKVSHANCIPANFFWDDVGNWESLFRIKPVDQNGNVILPQEKCFTKDSKDNLCLIDDHKFVVLNGVSNLIVISKNDKIYIASRDSAGEIKNILKMIENEKKIKY